MEKKCVVCDKMYFAKRATSKFCSATCRKAYSRSVDDEPVVQEETKLEDDEWFNCAETKTQEEIEAHFTLENFPPVTYHTTGGGGRGSRSPYPMSDPRSKAYL